ncbi:MAG TPA: MFS transporter [Phycisphaerae bacterium]|nr:MFS transporter [Phycisphaerae bacterium]HOJ73655.1 MFS transporter [Phycisphaerae bacterium]HOM50302.1 MFS transporter [Phycisphaerae bacterium]HON68644.1 MFS transporter [Phycisphaerae bacterium]HOQ84856.1 MFS transporter [Phycisphaerae bacterium]
MSSTQSDQLLPSSTQRQNGDQPPVTKREIFGWCMYDVADSAFTTIIVTAVFAIYFEKIVTNNSPRSDLWWGWAASISEIVVALAAPVLGAIADFSGSRKKFLGACAAIIILFTASLWFAGPGTTVLAITLYVIANIGFAGGGVFIDSFLPGISHAGNAGRISGLKWAMGYAGGLVCLALCLPLAKNIVENPTREQLSMARLVPVVVAVWYAVMVLPTFLFVRDRSVPKPLPPGDSYLRVGFRQLAQTFRHIRQYRELVKLMIAFLVYNDGVVTVIYFAAKYASTTVGFNADEIVTMFIGLNVVAVGGALSFGWLADRIGQKRTIMLSLCIWIAAIVLAYFSYSKTTFYVVAVLAGIGMGSAQSVTRSLVALFTPQENAAEFFGFLGVAGKALAFLGPLVFGTISASTGSQRPAILAIGSFFVAGMILLAFVNEQRGKEAARVPVPAE